MGEILSQLAEVATQIAGMDCRALLILVVILFVLAMMTGQLVWGKQYRALAKQEAFYRTRLLKMAGIVGDVTEVS